MPSTEYFGFTLDNLGPLTTTFTAPSPCATKSDFLGWQSHRAVDDDSNSTASSIYVQYLGRVSCESKTYGICLPSGEAIDKIRETTASRLWYHSPGIACPDGWTTAGTIKGGPEPTGSGEFSDLTPMQGDVQVMLLPQLFTNVLEAEETMAMCCPSGWKAEGLTGGCSSQIGKLNSVPYSTACKQIWTGLSYEDHIYVTSYDGKTWDPPLRSQVLITEAPTPVTVTLGTTTRHQATQTGDIYLVTNTPGLFLVHKQADLDKTGENGKGSGSTARVGIVMPIVSVALSLFFGAGFIV